MNLKSLVNMSIIKSDLRRFWYLCALFLGGLLLTVAMPVIENVNSHYWSSQPREFFSVASAGLLIIVPFCVIAPAVIFGYLHKKSAVCATHALPLKRGTIFFSHIVSIAMLVTIPLIINALIMLSVNEIYAPDVLKWFGASLVYCILICGISITSSAIAGNIFAAMAIPAIIMLLPAGVGGLFEVIANEYLFGYSIESARGVWNVINGVYLSYKSLLGAKSLIYIGLGLVFTAIGLICYKKRALENNSNVVAFKTLNPVFIYGVAVFGGLLGALYVSAVTDYFSLWCALPFGIIGVIVARMLITKTFKPVGVIKPALVYIAIMAVIYAFFGLDITGYEKRVPDIDKIASVDISGRSDDEEHYHYRYIGDEKIYVATEAKISTKITDKADIEKVLALHSSIVDGPHIDITKTSAARTTMPIVYTLKNGKTIARRFYYDATDAQEALLDTVNDIDVVKEYRYPVTSTAERIYLNGVVDTCYFKPEQLNEEQISQLVGALSEDIKNTPAKNMESEPLTKVEFTITLPMVNEVGERVEPDEYNRYVEHETYYIRPSFTNSVKLLSDWGMYKVMPKASDVEFMSIETINEDGTRADGEEIRDKAQIQKYLDYLEETYEIDNHKKATIMIAFDYVGDGGWSIDLPEKPQF